MSAIAGECRADGCCEPGTYDYDTSLGFSVYLCGDHIEEAVRDGW